MEISDGQRRSRAVSVLSFFLRNQDVTEVIHDVSSILADESSRFASVPFYEREKAIQRFARLCNVSITVRDNGS